MKVLSWPAVQWLMLPLVSILVYLYLIIRIARWQNAYSNTHGKLLGCSCVLIPWVLHIRRGISEIDHALSQDMWLKYPPRSVFLTWMIYTQVVSGRQQAVRLRGRSGLAYIDIGHHMDQTSAANMKLIPPQCLQFPLLARLKTQL